MAKEKNWWMKFEYRVWQSDPQLSQCSLAARGFWLEILCSMVAQGVYQVTGSFEQIGRMARCDSSEVAKYAMELKNTKAADVTLGNGSVTLLSRRLKRELSTKENNKLRVQKHRGNADVTVHSKSNSKSKTNPYGFENENQPLPINSSSEEKLFSWLDTVAVAVGAGKRAGLADSRWDRACIKAIESGLDRDQFAAVVKREYSTNPKYTSPAKCVEIAQAERQASAQPKFDIDFSPIYR